MSDRHRVVIVGGGFGGLAAAKALRKAPVDITLVDRRNHHLFQPLLYQVAGAALAPGDIAAPIRGVLAGQDNVKVLLGEATGVDLDRRVLHTDRLDLHYDSLVLAAGMRNHWFGNEDWAQHAPGAPERDSRPYPSPQAPPTTAHPRRESLTPLDTVGYPARIS